MLSLASSRPQWGGGATISSRTGQFYPLNYGERFAILCEQTAIASLPFSLSLPGAFTPVATVVLRELLRKNWAMASVIQMKNGRWRVQVRRPNHKHKCKTFDRKIDADKWGRARDAEIDSGNVAPEPATITVGKFIAHYKSLRAAARPILDTSTEHYTFKKLESFFGRMIAANLTPQEFIAFAIMRKDEGAGEYTINMDVSKLGTVLRLASSSMGVKLPDVVAMARPLLSHMRLIGGGGLRERRPTEDELTAVLNHLALTYGQIYADVVAFAAISAMRRGECCALKVSDIDTVKRVIPVWRKHPRKGKVLEVVPIVGESWDIVLRQPASVDGRVFPIHPQTISKYFKETCVALSIPDLRFHDMRHEGTSRLFEAGNPIEKVALVTGHKSWAHLKRYTNLKPESMSQPKPIETIETEQ